MRLLAHTRTLTPVPGPQMLPHPPAPMAAPTAGLPPPYVSGHAPPKQPSSPTVAASHVRPHLIISPVSAAILAACAIRPAASAILCARSSGVRPSSRSAPFAILRAACATASG
eukprot:GHVU01229150.1.p3 GENE.GHVU01229150.1~~GHVU01229150.1.p3  ORF type:complete len:113 (-),score=0.45 GHVU01229150.1:10-348(-)